MCLRVLLAEKKVLMNIAFAAMRKMIQFFFFYFWLQNEMTTVWYMHEHETENVLMNAIAAVWTSEQMNGKKKI